jgi:hypothetical protein
MKIAKVITLPYPDLLIDLSESLLYNPKPTPEAIAPIVFKKIRGISKLLVEAGLPDLASYY